MVSSAEYLAENKEWYSALNLRADAIVFLRARLLRTSNMVIERDRATQALHSRLRAFARVMVDTGDMTPYAKMKLEQILQGEK